VQADVVAGPDAPLAQVVGEPVGLGVELGVRASLGAADHGRPLPDGVREPFEQVSVVELHEAPSFSSGACGVSPAGQGLSRPTIHIAKNWAPPP
jgi:hypothetical protein